MSDALRTPTRVEPLAYAQAREDPWLTIIRAVAVVTVVMCIARIVESAARLVIAFSGGRVLWRFPRMAALEGLYVTVDVAGDMAAALLIVGAFGAWTLRRWSRAVVIWSAVAVIAAAAFNCAWLVMQVVTGRAFGGSVMEQALTIMRFTVAVLVQVLAPMLFIWLMRRAEVRRRFAGQVVGS